MSMSSKVQAWSRVHFLPRLTPPVIVRVVADALLITAAFSTALLVRFCFEGQKFFSQDFSEYWLAYLTNTGLLTGACLAISYFSGLYSYGRAYRPRYKVWLVTRSVTLSYLLCGFFNYFAR